MNKLNHVHNLSDLTGTEIEFLIGKNSIEHNSNANFSFKCSNCHTDEFIVQDTFGGFDVCQKCGEVVDTAIFDHNPEWKVNDDNSQPRCGNPTNPLYPQSSMGTAMAGKCPNKLKKLHNWSIVPHRERSLNGVLTDIKKKCDSVGLVGCIKDDAQILYKITSECKTIDKKNNIIVRNKNKTGLMAACIFYACKRKGETKSQKEIAKMFGVKQSCVNKGCKNFIKYVQYKNIDYNTNLSYPIQYIKPFCAKLTIDKKYIILIESAAQNIQKINIVSSHTPISIAVACILLCSEHYQIPKINKLCIAKTFNISIVTLMKAYEKLVNFTDSIFSDDKTNKIVQDQSNKVINVRKELVDKLEKIKLINLNNYMKSNMITLHKYMNVNIFEHIHRECIAIKEYEKNYKKTRLLSTLT